MKIITKVVKLSTSDLSDGWDYDLDEVLWRNDPIKKCTVTKIEEYTPDFEGDFHCCIVYFSNKTEIRICRPDAVSYKEEE